MTLPYRITDELGAVLGSVTFDRAALLRALNAIEAPPPPPPGYTLYPGQDPAEAIADLSAGDTLWLADGTHPYPIHLTKAINVRAVDGARPVVSGWGYPGKTYLPWEHVGNGLWKTLFGRWGLNHQTVTNAAFLAAPDGPARLAAHNLATQPELVVYEGDPLRRVAYADIGKRESLTQAYDAKDGRLYIVLPDGVKPHESVKIATVAQLFTAADGVAGITVEGITFTGAANTHKQAAFELHSDGNTIDVEVDLVNSLAFSVRGIGLQARMISKRAGQMGHWIKCQKSRLEIIHTESNWRGSDAGWHASNKQEQTIDCDITITAMDCNGPGGWFDVGNHRNRVKLISNRSRKNALIVEHYAEDNDFDVEIIDTQPLGRWTGADIQIQSNVKGNTFTGHIDGDAVPYWLAYKTQENRGPSGPNTFRNIDTGGRLAKFEPARHEKDVFEAIT